MPNNQTIPHYQANLYDIFYASKAKKTYTNIGVSLILIIVFLAFALVPTLTTLDDIQDKIIAFKKVNTGLKTKIESIKKLSTQRETNDDGGLKNEIDFLDKVFVSNLNLNSIYINLSRRAKNSNIKIQSITPNYPQDSSSEIGDFVLNAPSDISYELQVSILAPDRQSLVDFVKSLEGPRNIPIPIRIKSLLISDLQEEAKSRTKTNNDTNSNQAETGINADITIIVYLDNSRYTQDPTSSQ